MPPGRRNPPPAKRRCRRCGGAPAWTAATDDGWCVCAEQRHTPYCEGCGQPRPGQCGLCDKCQSVEDRRGCPKCGKHPLGCGCDKTYWKVAAELRRARAKADRDELLGLRTKSLAIFDADWGPLRPRSSLPEDQQASIAAYDEHCRYHRGRGIDPVTMRAVE